MELQNDTHNNPQEGDTQPTGEKTFTQDDLNRIVSKRLAEEKSKSEAEFSKREQELNQRELNLKAKEVLAEKKLPEQLVEVLKFSDEETLNKSVEVIAEIMNGSEKPKIPLKTGMRQMGTDCMNCAETDIRKAMKLE